MIRTAIALAAFVVTTPSVAHDMNEATNSVPVMELDELLTAFGWDLEATDITSEQITDGLHVLFGLGGNIAVSSGPDGTLIVDDQFPQLMPKIKEAMREFGDDDVDVVVNTHWHFDHAEGNLALGQNKDTQIVAHKNSRAKMLEDHIVNLVSVKYDQKAYPAHALPDVTYDTAMSFWFNGEEVSLLHFGAAHTTGDTAVFFRTRNAVHMGDVFNNSGYPFIDAGNGGDINGMISFCESVLAELNDETIVIPGHGPVTDIADMARYVEILTLSRDRIKAMIDEGKTLKDIITAKPTAEFDEELGASEGNVGLFVDRAYTSLTR